MGGRKRLARTILSSIRLRFGFLDAYFAAAGFDFTGDEPQQSVASRFFSPGKCGASKKTRLRGAFLVATEM
jgi:hypothetical protein